jgi:hypothetical protein
MRARNSRVNSTDEIFFAASAPESSPRVEFNIYSMTLGTR